MMTSQNTYTCNKCGMSVTGMKCGQCNKDLQHNTIKNDQGKEVHVCECAEHGKIKSPMCCNEDMKVQ